MSICERHGGRFFVLFCSALALAGLLAACGGGGGGLPPMVDSLGRQVAEADFGGGDASAAGADGTAFDAGPLANASLSLSDATGATRTALTDSSGYYRVSIKGLTPPFIARVRRADGSEWFSASTASVQPRAFVSINLSGVTDKTLGDVAEAAGVATGAASAVTPAMLAANPDALVAAKARIRTGLAAPLTNAGLDAAGYDPMTTALRATAPDAHALFLGSLTMGRNAQGRSAVSGVVTGAASVFNVPMGVAVDPQGNVLVGDSENNVVRRISPAGVVTTLAGSGQAGSANGPAAAATFNRPVAVLADSKGNVLVADRFTGGIRKISADGMVTTLVGPTGDPALSAFPVMAMDAADNVYVLTSDFAVKKLTPAGVVSIVATRSACCSPRTAGDYSEPHAIAAGPDGTVYISASRSIVKVTPAGLRSDLVAPGAAAGFDPGAIGVDARGVVHASDVMNRIWKVTPDGAATLLAGGGRGYANGSGAAARFGDLGGIALDAAGNVLVADATNNAIRKITPAGEVSTLAGKRTGFVDGQGPAAAFGAGSLVGVADLGAVAIEADGAIIVADPGNHAIRKISATGHVSTLAGNGAAGFVDGTGRAAQFNMPLGVALDGNGNVLVADSGNHAIRRISAAGIVTTVAGTGAAGFIDGAGAVAAFNSPGSLAVARTGDIYVSDGRNSALRRIGPGGAVSTVVIVGGAGPAETIGAIVVDSGGAVHFMGRPRSAGIFASAIFSVALDGAVRQRTPSFSPSLALAIDGRDNLYYLRAPASLVRLGPADDVTEVFNASSLGAYSMAADRAGNLVLSDAFNPMVRIVLP